MGGEGRWNETEAVHPCGILSFITKKGSDIETGQNLATDLAQRELCTINIYRRSIGSLCNTEGKLARLLRLKQEALENREHNPAFAGRYRRLLQSQT